ncbi:MAG: hypothetical protein MUF73_17960 [Rhodobacteraceae bacterium]|jgi:hypothetical protein|nr:hypothetical protein [Paracoccaceae bacterium]
MPEERKPFVRWEISVGTMASLAVMVIALLQGGQIVGAMRSEIAQQAQALDDMETRLRSQELTVTRNDEKTANILALLARIDARLERIERNGGYEQP